jgi:hypothetical protein
MLEDKSDKQRFLDILINRGVTLRCSKCKSEEFTLLDDYIIEEVWPMDHPLEYAETSTQKVLIPSVVIMCNNCGHMDHHAVGILEKWTKMPQDE